MFKLRASRKFWTVLGIAVLAAVAACLLPADTYQRWQLLNGTIHARSRWTYERIHFDPTPIDVAVIGPSRTMAVDPLRLEAGLRARGAPARVVNFALPEGGRNINYVFVHEMLKTKTPKLLVIGVVEKPSRFGHPAYKYVAPNDIVANPGYLGNLRYLSDLAYMPFRQMRLFLANILPGGTGLTKTFIPSRYAGPSIGRTANFQLPDGTRRSWTEPATYYELARGVHKLEAGNTPAVLPRALADVEFGDERYYLRKIAAEARAKGARVVFVFLPYYTGPSTIQELGFYERFGPVWSAAFLAPSADLYADYAHLDTEGSKILTDWLTPKVAQMLAGGAPGQ